MNLELKIKMENKKEVVLDEKEAKELFEKLKSIFGTKEKEYVPYYPYWKYYEWPYQSPVITYTTCNTSDGSEWKTVTNNVSMRGGA